MHFECVWCHGQIDVERAGWAYIQSVALLHLHSCPSRPPDVTPEAIAATAAQIADAMDKKFRED
ncbi:MAG TPA: hypothetical protein VF980_00265 [Thermoanaerobaculia bacterium]